MSKDIQNPNRITSLALEDGASIHARLIYSKLLAKRDSGLFVTQEVEAFIYSLLSRIKSRRVQTLITKDLEALSELWHVGEYGRNTVLHHAQWIVDVLTLTRD